MTSRYDQGRCARWEMAAECLRNPFHVGGCKKEEFAMVSETTAFANAVESTPRGGRHCINDSLRTAHND